jgi:hypothetical protein
MELDIIMLSEISQVPKVRVVIVGLFEGMRGLILKEQIHRLLGTSTEG